MNVVIFVVSFFPAARAAGWKIASYIKFEVYREHS